MISSESFSSMALEEQEQDKLEPEVQLHKKCSQASSKESQRNLNLLKTN